MNIDKDAIQAAVIEKVAAELIEDHDFTSQARKEVRDKIACIFADEADAAIRSEVQAAVKAGFEHEYCRVNSFGQREGEPTTISKELKKIVGCYWNARVEPKTGKPTTSEHGSVTRAEYVMTTVCAEDFSKSMKQHMVNVTAGLKDGLRAQVAQQMDLMLNELFRVNSLQDQGKQAKPY